MNNFTLLNSVKNRRFSFKNYYLKALLVIAFLGLSQMGFGQAFSVTYALTANGNSVVSGNVTSTSLVGGSNIGAIGYGTTNGSSANGFGSPALNLNDYYEYSITPLTGNNLAINSTSFYYSVSGGSMNLVVFYSKDNFATSGTQLGSIVNFSNTSSTVQFTNSTSITVNNGETLKVRVYGYGASADTRTFRNKTFVISGTSTSTSTSPTISKSGSLSALTTVYGTASSTSTFSVSGANMEEGILVTPPTGFEVSTNSTSGFADSITVGALGTIASTPVYIRLKATTTVGSYSGNVVLTSLNATTVNVATVSSTVTAKALTISGVTANNKVYDSFTTATLSGTPSFVGAVNSDVLTVSGTPTATFASATVGTGKTVTVTGYTVSGTNSASYTVSNLSLTADITQASQTINFTLASPILYPSVLTVTLGATATSGLAVTYASSNPAIASVSGNVVTIHSVGTVTITASQAGNTNYATATNVDQTLDIQANGLSDQTITFNALANATYGDAPITLTATASSSLPVTYTSSNTAVATVSGNTVTILTNGVTTITASQAGDASYNPAPNVQQTLTVNQKALTVTGAVASNKVYNRTIAATITGATLVGIVGTDVVTVSGAGTFADFNVGTAKPVTASLSLGGAKASLYTLTQPSGLTADITPKALTVTGATVIAKVYDGTTVANLGGTAVLSGIVSGDTGTVSIVTTSVVANYDNANVGTGKAVTVSGYTLSGASSGNYSLTQPSLTGNITAKALTITGVTANNKVQDGTTAATLSGTPTLVGVEAVDNGNVTVTGTPTATFASAAPAPAIAVTVTGYTLGGTAAGNYTVSQPTGLTAEITGLAAPVANPATGVLQTTFNANWDAVSGATSYALDVSTGFIESTFTEPFTSISGAAASYLTRTWTGANSLSWTAYKSRTDQTLVASNAAITLQDASGAYIQSDVINNNPKTISFNVQQKFAGTGGAIAVKILSGSGYATSTTIGTYAFSTTLSTITANVSGISGPFKVVLENNASARPCIDDLAITTENSTFVGTYNNFNVGNVTTYTVTVPSPETTYYYRVRAVNGSFQSANSSPIAVTTKPVSVTWNGTAWSNTTGPDADIEAVISGAYNTATNSGFTAKTLTVTSVPAGSLTIAAGTNVTVVNEVVNELSETAFVVKSDGNLIQTNDVTNTGAITVERLSAPIARLDYTLWSSPVDGQQLQAFSPGTVATRFYSFNPTLTPLGGSAGQGAFETITSTNPFVEGNGYLIRASNWQSTTATPWLGTFKGVPNNGNVSVTTTSGSWYAIGNPYPSTIDADEFINANSLTQPLYFWRKVNGSSNPSYATYTLVGQTGVGSPNTAGGSTITPDRIIAAGQGFLTQATSSSLVFTNALRNGEFSSQFLRTASNNRSRVWLNLSDNEGFVNQMLVGYMATATTGIDAAMDGRFLELNTPTQLSSIISGQEFAVQGRPAFTASDVVALGFKTQTEGNYTIAIDHVDGLFADGQEVFLKDNMTNTVHNLTNAPYNFVATTGTTNTRFEIIYESTLATQNPVLNENMVTIYKQNQSLVINSGAVEMKNVKVYDIQGRLLVEQKDVNAATAKLAISSTNQVLIVKVTSKEGTIVTKKVVF